MKEICVDWAVLKQRAVDGWPLWYVKFPQGTDESPAPYKYDVFTTNYQVFGRATTHATGQGSDSEDFENTYKTRATEVGSPDEALLLAQPPINTNFVQQVEQVSRTGKLGFDQFTIATPNFCDPTTWYQDSAAWDGGDGSPGYSMTDSGDHATFTSGKNNWINIDDFRMAIQEYSSYKVGPWKASGAWWTKGAFRPVIKVNGVVATSGYVIDYAAGSVTFDSPVASPYDVKATFRQANTADFVVRCPSGRRFIPHVEINVSKDVVLNGCTVLEIYAGDRNYGFEEAYLQYRMSYESWDQLVELSTAGGDVYPGLGGTRSITPGPRTGWASGMQRGTTVDRIEIPFDFGKPGSHGKVIELRSSQFAVARIRMEWDSGYPAHGGELLNATFYCEDEPEL